MVNIDEAKSQWKAKIEKQKVYSRLYSSTWIFFPEEKKDWSGTEKGATTN